MIFNLETPRRKSAEVRDRVRPKMAKSEDRCDYYD
jgi:hypothetical protein